MNLRRTVDDIRAAVVRSAASRDGPIGTEDNFAPLRKEFHRLVLSYEQLCSMRNAVGRMPPSPNTLRAKVGSLLVRLVQRMLFWYTPQIHRFQNATTAVAENTCATIEKQISEMLRLYREIAAVRWEMRVRTSVIHIDGPSLTTTEHRDDPCFDHLRFSLRNKTQGTAEERQEKLRTQLTTIDGLAPAVPAGMWLEIGCGRGDWIGMVAASGREAIGLEDNRVAVAHCAAAGLKAVFCDPLGYLRQTPDAQYAVISAPQVFNRFPPRYVSELIRESARSLKHGGAFMLESLNPASLVASAEGAWCDLDGHRPLPAATAEFLLDYYGLQVVRQLHLDAYPDERRLPFAELEFIRQLNADLYSAATYVLIARPRKALDPEMSVFEGEQA